MNRYFGCKAANYGIIFRLSDDDVVEWINTTDVESTWTESINCNPYNFGRWASYEIPGNFVNDLLDQHINPEGSRAQNIT